MLQQITLKNYEICFTEDFQICGTRSPGHTLGIVYHTLLEKEEGFKILLSSNCHCRITEKKILSKNNSLWIKSVDHKREGSLLCAVRLFNTNTKFKEWKILQTRIEILLITYQLGLQSQKRSAEKILFKRHIFKNLLLTEIQWARTHELLHITTLTTIIKVPL